MGAKVLFHCSDLNLCVSGPWFDTDHLCLGGLDFPLLQLLSHGLRACWVFSSSIASRRCVVKLESGHDRQICTEVAVLRALVNVVGVPRVVAVEFRAEFAALVTMPLGRSVVQLAPAEAVQCSLDLVGILERVHALGYVHGDVSPDNVVMDEGCQTYLVDWGVAVRVGALSTRIGKARFASERLNAVAESDVIAVSAVDDLESVLHVLDYWLHCPRRSRVVRDHDDARRAIKEASAFI